MGRNYKQVDQSPFADRPGCLVGRQPGDADAGDGGFNDGVGRIAAKRGLIATVFASVPRPNGQVRTICSPSKPMQSCSARSSGATGVPRVER